MVQSDASGVDGFGYSYNTLADNQSYQWTAKDWETLPHNSHQAELCPLLDFLKFKEVANTIIIWVTDGESAVWSVNKGCCKIHGLFLFLNKYFLL